MTLPCITCTKDPRKGSYSHGCAELTAYFTAKDQDKLELPQIVASDAVPPGEVLAIGPDDNGQLTGTLLVNVKKVQS